MALGSREGGAAGGPGESVGGADGSLAGWLRDRRLLRGPFLFVDYWASVLRLGGIIPARHIREGFVDPPLFRLALDRPDLEVPRVGRYTPLFLLWPILLSLRSFGRPGRHWLRPGRGVGEDAVAELEPYRLELDPAGPGRVDVRKGSTILARAVIDPFRVVGFCSLFWATYKLPIASLSAILVVAILTPILSAAGLLDVVIRYWIPIGVPLIVAILYLAYREWLTAILGALPILFGRYLVAVFDPEPGGRWGPFFLALAGLFTLYLAVDWFFLPRAVPPVLLLYTADEPGFPYARPADAPYWLEGRSYWVWRYLILSPAELNKFWERDWERVDLWIRADGPSAGRLEWVVTDLHYREIWIPYGKLGAPETLARNREKADEAMREGGAGIWLLEVDADLVVHYPFFRKISFLPEGALPSRSIVHAAGGLWKRAKEEDVERHLRALDRTRLRTRQEILRDVPELIAGRAARHIVAQPWTYWRYPLGAATREELRVYGLEPPVPPPPAADPNLQFKAERDA